RRASSSSMRPENARARSVTKLVASFVSTSFVFSLAIRNAPRRDMAIFFFQDGLRKNQKKFRLLTMFTENIYLLSHGHTCKDLAGTRTSRRDPKPASG